MCAQRHALLCFHCFNSCASFLPLPSYRDEEQPPAAGTPHAPLQQHQDTGQHLFVLRPELGQSTHGACVHEANTTHEHQGSERAGRSPAAPSRRPDPTPHDKQRPGLASQGGGGPVLGPSSPSQLELQRGHESCPQFLYPKGLRCSEALPDGK